MLIHHYTKDGSIKVEIGGWEAIVPDDMSNRHRQQIAEWEAEGNTIPPCPADPAPSLADYQDAIRAHMDKVANERDYDSAVTISTYSNSTNPIYKADADCFIAWRDRLFEYANAEMRKFYSGERPQPLPSDFISELATIQWPPLLPEGE